MKEFGKDYFLFKDEVRLKKHTVKAIGKRVWILTGITKKKEIWYSWAVKMYRKFYGSYFLVDETIKNVDEVIDLIDEIAATTIRSLIFTWCEIERLSYVMELGEKVIGKLNEQQLEMYYKPTEIINLLNDIASQDNTERMISVFGEKVQKGIQF